MTPNLARPEGGQLTDGILTAPDRHRLCDMAAEHLTSEISELRDRQRDIAADRDTYRELFQLAIHALHALRSERDRLREQHVRVLDEYRALRTGRQEAA